VQTPAVFLCAGYDSVAASEIVPLKRITPQPPPLNLFPQTLRLLLGSSPYEAIAIAGGQIRSMLLPDVFIEIQNAFVR
jgi:hypothetical protein